MQVAAFFVGSEKSDGDFAAGADLAFEAIADPYQGKVITQLRAQPGQAQASSVKARCAVAAVIVVIGDVFQRTGFESGVSSCLAKVCIEWVHRRNVTLRSCGLLLYNSYSIWRVRILDGLGHSRLQQCFHQS
jgi:hypothetical protein